MQFLRAPRAARSMQQADPQSLAAIVMLAIPYLLAGCALAAKIVSDAADAYISYVVRSGLWLYPMGVLLVIIVNGFYRKGLTLRELAVACLGPVYAILAERARRDDVRINDFLLHLDGGFRILSEARALVLCSVVACAGAAKYGMVLAETENWQQLMYVHGVMVYLTLVYIQLFGQQYLENGVTWRELAMVFLLPLRSIGHPG